MTPEQVEELIKEIDRRREEEDVVIRLVSDHGDLTDRTFFAITTQEETIQVHYGVPLIEPTMRKKNKAKPRVAVKS